MKHIALSFILIALLLCSCGNNSTKSKITAEMAYEGVSNYCHSAYEWSVAKENPSIMYVQMGEETDSAYQVVFRSYTGAFVNFYVNKTSGTTRMEETAEINFQKFRNMDFLPKDPAILVSSVNMLLRDEEFDHKRFGNDITLAVDKLEKML